LFFKLKKNAKISEKNQRNLRENAPNPPPNLKEFVILRRKIKLIIISFNHSLIA
jgi:hypothetical protein